MSTREFFRPALERSPRLAFRLLLVATAGASLAGCGSTNSFDSLAMADASRPLAAAAEPKAKSDHRVDETTRGILMAAGLDPADPAKPKEIRQKMAAVVQIRVRGRAYGTAFIRPAPGRLALVDPAAVAGMLNSGDGKSELAQALKGSMVDIDSRDCQFDQRADRKTRKAFRLQKICPAPTGMVWADLNRREMILDLQMQPRLAALVDNAPATPQLAETPAPATASQDAEAAPVSMASINLFAPNLLAGPSTPVDRLPPAAAPISLQPVVLPLPKYVDPVDALVAPRAATPVVLTATPAAAPVTLSPPTSLMPPAAGTSATAGPAPRRGAVQEPSYALVAGGDLLQPTVIMSGGPSPAIRESESSFSAAADIADRHPENITVLSGAYQPAPPPSSFGFGRH